MIQDRNNQPNIRMKSFPRRILYRTLLVFIPVFILIFLGSISILLIEEKIEPKSLLNTEESYANTKLDDIETEINHVIDNLLILSLNKGILKVLEDGESRDAIKLLTDDFKIFSNYYKLYDQVRLIDENGNETIRINFINGQPIVVPESELQNKKNRYYFTDAFKLSEFKLQMQLFDYL